MKDDQLPLTKLIVRYRLSTWQAWQSELKVWLRWMLRYSVPSNPHFPHPATQQPIASDSGSVPARDSFNQGSARDLQLASPFLSRHFGPRCCCCPKSSLCSGRERILYSLIECLVSQSSVSRSWCISIGDCLMSPMPIVSSCSNHRPTFSLMSTLPGATASRSTRLPAAWFHAPTFASHRPPPFMIHR